eukprot:CAMPEP_0182438290 /NCGR_PEP_ID=MMETSP1167-20130531/85654_1 /TAXON_ID=2988 /ORGANISM="Mallomonas Sp, Strain CCMP3275" /LENGTH=376 /DNA_ID=CAMNT_0024631571 /DNA_START=1832 /DNA_END=2962 /DNA_ORIENTATION=+
MKEKSGKEKEREKSGEKEVLTTEKEREREKAVWKAKEADLERMRRDFHGAVTYGFEGVFAWQMYGAASSSDISGVYTEYLMRCQWGPDFSSLQPWMVTRRFREFEALDNTLRLDYPQISHLLPQLPPKLYLTIPGVMTALGLGGEPDEQIIARRKLALEHYITAIITAIPMALQSRVFQEFLNVPERIQIINTSLARDRRIKREKERVTGGERERERRVSEVSGYDSEKPLSIQELLTSESADRIRLNRSSRPLSLSSLDDLHSQVRSLSVLLRALPPSTLLQNTELRVIVRDCMSSWPGLRGIIQGKGLDQIGLSGWSEEEVIQLIARALQIEDELNECVNKIRNILGSKQNTDNSNTSSNHDNNNSNSNIIASV